MEPKRVKINNVNVVQEIKPEFFIGSSPNPQNQILPTPYAPLLTLQHISPSSLRTSVIPQRPLNQNFLHDPKAQSSSRPVRGGIRLGSNIPQPSLSQIQPPPLLRPQHIPLPDVPSPPPFSPELVLQPQVQSSSRCVRRGNQLGSNIHQPSVAQIQPPPLPHYQQIPLPNVSSPPQFFPELVLQIDLRIPLQSYYISLLSTVTIPSDVTEIRVEGLGCVHLGKGSFTALDVIRFLKDTLDGSVPFSEYSMLSPDMQIDVEKYFMGRMWSERRHTPDAYKELWLQFLEGRGNPDGPVGVDLFLGKTQVTAFGPDPHSGEWRVVVMRPAI